MPAAYILFIKQQTTDPAEMDLYRSKVAESFIGHDPTFHVTYGRQEVLEGAPAEGVVVLEFPDWDAARQWYDSPEYQAAAAHRFKGAKYQAILVEGRATA